MALEASCPCWPANRRAACQNRPRRGIPKRAAPIRGDPPVASFLPPVSGVTTPDGRLSLSPGFPPSPLPDLRVSSAGREDRDVAGQWSPRPALSLAPYARSDRDATPADWLTGALPTPPGSNGDQAGAPLMGERNLLNCSC